MRKFLLILLSAIFATVSYGFPSMDDDNSSSSGPIVFILPVDPYPDKLPQNPRSLSPISGWCANGSVELYFSSDLGAVDIAVTNNTSGEVWFTTAESSEGFIAIAINPQPGDYTVTIQTETAGTFVGEFCL